MAEVRGQEQVTRPLSVALDNGRISHAYLFSGPRGCGKTSTARILARSLNCEHGPTSTPCGECASCKALAPGGQGNLDVTELDAASHGNVDDMRELRETAYYAPSDSRYRIIIIDEAHMITQAGSNALLKVVEEPPEHLIFIFATTEPEKVIPTIRSRVQHYPFRLLTPPTMRELLLDIATDEGIQVEDAVYPLVIRAGGGSPRDSLSILDQLFSGVPAGQQLTYDLAAPLLGVTDSSLIDAAVTAIATKDRASAFSLVGRVIDAGIDPKRFTTDLLDRLRDLMVLQAVPDALTGGLIDAPAAAHPTFTEEVAAFAGQDLPAVAATAADGLDSMRGTLAPRIMLEVLMAKLLAVGSQPTVPASVSTSTGVVQQPGSTPAGQVSEKYMRPSQRAAMQAQKQQSEPTVQPSPQPPAQPTPEMPTQSVPEPPAPVQPSSESAAQPFTIVQLPADAEVPAPAPEPEPEPQTSTIPASAQESVPEPVAPAPTMGVTLEQVTAVWRDVLEALSTQRNNRTARILLTSAKVVDVRENTVFVSLLTGALAQRLNDEPHHTDLSAALTSVLGTQVSAQAVTGSQLPKDEPEAEQPPVAPAPAVPPVQTVSPESPLPPEPEVPLPPVSEPPLPEPDLPPEPSLDPAPALSPEEEREQEEAEMARAAYEDEANYDHRTPLQVAVELIETELGGHVYER